MTNNTTAHDDATTWRDLADQLTPEQVARMKYWERQRFAPDLAEPENLLSSARRLIGENLIQNLCAGIAAPADSIDEPSRWIQWDHGDYCRMFTSTATRTGAGITVLVLGHQYHDGRVERWLCIDDSACDAASTMADRSPV